MKPINLLQTQTNIKVRFNETDPLGIVWHGHYVTYLEDGRENFGNAFGISYLEILNSGFLAPVVKCTCNYKKPLRFGDTGIVETTYIHQPATKMVFHYKIRNNKNEIIATGETIQVFTNKEGELQLGDPAFFAEWKKKWELI